ncbi:MAG TPA: S26 family signal peptidase [Pirellulales bacterium]|nr:S26 family signal peptidase [Pirellulales bacterium]
MKSQSPTKQVVTSHLPKDTVRETVESIVVAFILAFLFRTFEAEAFVIPTGSMAPTLMGQHKDLDCPQCGFTFQVGVKEDPRWDISGCTCPNCRYVINFEHDYDRIPTSFKGDRIIVSKFPYEFGDPSRWDVAVFKYPATAKTNFIKRIVGLPRERLRVLHGNIYTKPDGATDFKIETKPPEKVLAMLQMVYDNDHCLPNYIAKGLPARWTSATAAGSSAWQPSEDYRTFELKAPTQDQALLRYEHRTPDANDWAALKYNPDSPNTRQRLSEIPADPVVDFCAYDTGFRDEPYLGAYAVGDLALECELEILRSEQADPRGGEAVLELIEGGRAFRCRIDLSTGDATLLADDLPSFKPTAKTAVRGTGRHRLRFSNVDDQLLVWVDDALVAFDAPTRYELPWQGPSERDGTPASIAVRGVAARLSHLRVLRDVYYLTEQESRGIASQDNNPVALNGSREPMEFTLAADQFLVFGDNSPKSKDSRLWTRSDEFGKPEYYVSRELLIGKAMFVYWPHALDTIPGTGMTLPPALQWVPNFARRRFIR